MTNHLLTLFCLVDGESSPFPVEIESAKTIGVLKDAIKTALAPQFDDVAAKDITLWHVSIPLAPLNQRKPIVLNEFDSATELDPTDDVSDVFEAPLPKKTVHIIIRRPPPGNPSLQSIRLPHEVVLVLTILPTSN